MKIFKLITILTIFILTACAGPTIDKEALEQAKNQTFRIGTIKIPCDLRGIPSRPSYDVRTQRKMLKAIDHKAILQILSETYGLKFSERSDLELDTYPMRLLGLLSERTGRCSSFKNVLSPDNLNVVDIEYDLDPYFYDAKPTVAKFSYKITIKSGKRSLAQHIGPIETVNYKNWLTEDDFDQIINTARKIPEAFKREIDGTMKQSH